MGSNPTASALHKLTQRLLYVSSSEILHGIRRTSPVRRGLYKGEAMADWDENEETGGIKELRKAFKEQGKQLKTALEALNELKQGQEATKIYEVLASRGMDPRIAKFYPKDSGTDDESVDKWLDENKELFGNRRVGEEGNVTESTLTDSEQRGYQTLKEIAAYEAAVQTDLKSRLDNIQFDPTNPEKAQNEVLATLKEFEGYVNQ